MNPADDNLRAATREKPPADRQPVLTTTEIPADRQDLLTTITAVVDLILPDYLTPRTAAHAGLRLACLAWLVGASSMRGVTQTMLGHKLGKTRALISKTVLELSDATGLRHRRQKSRAASPRYSAAARRGWALRRQNDHRVQTALAALADYPPAGVWLDLLPKHLRRQVLVLIGSLPTATAMRHAAARGAHQGWRKLSQVSKHAAEVIECHNDAAQGALLRLETGPAKESFQVTEREELATRRK
jgi:hypothetical protein